jgi:hypothetical protein
MKENREKWAPCMDTISLGETQDTAVARIKDKDFGSWKSKLEPLLDYEKKPTWRKPKLEPLIEYVEKHSKFRGDK